MATFYPEGILKFDLELNKLLSTLHLQHVRQQLRAEVVERGRAYLGDDSAPRPQIRDLLLAGK